MSYVNNSSQQPQSQLPSFSFIPPSTATIRHVQKQDDDDVGNRSVVLLATQDLDNSNSSSPPEQQFWLVSDLMPTTLSTSCLLQQQNQQQEPRARRAAALVQRIVSKQESQTESQQLVPPCADTFFPKGCTIQRISNLEELQQALNGVVENQQKQSQSSTMAATSIPSLTPPQQQHDTKSNLSLHPSDFPVPSHCDEEVEDENHRASMLTMTTTMIERQRQQQCSRFPVDLNEVKRFELFRRVIEHEDDLLNQRVSWIILAQSFLMAAFISTSSNSNGNALRYVTATVGLLTVIVTLPAIVAAGRNIEVQQLVYFQLLASDERCRDLHGHDRDGRKRAGEWQQRLTVGHILPTMAFRGGQSVPILTTVIGLAVVQVLGWIFLLLALWLEW